MGRWPRHCPCVGIAVLTAVLPFSLLGAPSTAPDLGAGPNVDPSQAFIVSADLLDGTERPQMPHCALAISANHIDGQFVALVLQVMPEPLPENAGTAPDVAGSTLSGLLKISPGTVDWRNGIESYIEPDLAWVVAADISTRDMGTPRSEPYAKVYQTELAGTEVTNVYRALLEGPVTVYVDSAGLESVYPLQVPFAPEVVTRAEACVQTLQAADRH